MRGFRPRLLTLLALGAAPGCVPVQGVQSGSAVRPAGPAHGAATITPDVIRRHVFVIADDSMGGRDTPSRGLEMTAAYIAERFRAAGLQPAGDSGSFLQRYPLAGSVTPTVGESVPVPATAPNVVGIVEGTDPVLKHQYVVFSAHMDHVGTTPGATPDSIWNGADDDASGTAGVIALAEAFATAPPRRSVIFLTVSGEEKGLWGSAWFADNPPVPLDSIVADLNMDMIGRNWRDTIAVIGREHSDLGETLSRVNRDHPELGLAAIGDIWPHENFYYRSDHYNFARRGVPILFFFNGTHEDYHGADDSPAKIDTEKTARIVKLVYYLGQEVANRDVRPKWDERARRDIVR